MNKTITIHLGGMMFYIEENAYLKLQEYLNSIQEHFSDFEGANEMINDIESSIAEKFSRKNFNKKEVVVLRDVTEMIEVMGKVEDFVADVANVKKREEKEDSTKQEKQEDTRRTIRKLYRNSDDIIIAGVCSGIAEYLGIDPVFVRLAFVALVFFGGSGILVYLVLWLVMPIAVTSSQKLEMQGDPVTLRKIEEVTKKKINELKTPKSNLRIIISKPFELLRSVFVGIKNLLKSIIPILSKLLGILIFVGSIVLITLGLFVLNVLIFKIDSPYIHLGFPVKEAIGSFSYNIGVVSFFFIFALPIIFLLLFGVSLVKKKNIIGFLLGGVIFGFWMFSFVVFGGVAVDAIPRVNEKVTEINDNFEQEYELIDFSSVEILNNNYNIFIKRGDVFQVKTIGRENDLGDVVLKIGDKNNLIVSHKKRDFNFCLFCDQEEVDIYIVMPVLENLYADAYSNIKIKGFDNEEMDINIQGQDFVEIDTFNSLLKLDISGYSSLTLLNSSSIVQANISGSSNFEISSHEAGDLNLKITDWGMFNMNNFHKFSSSSSINLILDMNENSRCNISDSPFDNVKINIDDYAKANLDGSASDFYIYSDSFSRVEAFDFFVDNVDVEAGGDSRILVEVSDTMNLKGLDRSTVIYKGNPEITKVISQYVDFRSYDE